MISIIKGREHPLTSLSCAILSRCIVRYLGVVNFFPMLKPLRLLVKGRNLPPLPPPVASFSALCLSLRLKHIASVTSKLVLYWGLHNSPWIARNPLHVLLDLQHPWNNPHLCMRPRPLSHSGCIECLLSLPPAREESCDSNPWGDPWGPGGFSQVYVEDSWPLLFRPSYHQWELKSKYALPDNINGFTAWLAVFLTDWLHTHWYKVLHYGPVLFGAIINQVCSQMMTTWP